MDLLERRIHQVKNKEKYTLRPRREDQHHQHHWPPHQNLTRYPKWEQELGCSSEEVGFGGSK